MMRSIKVLGLALVAMSALFAVVASSASAKEPVFYVGLPAVELSGTLLITILQVNAVKTENFLEATLAGTKVRIFCSQTEGDGTAVNDTGGPALVTGLTVKYTGCIVEEPKVAGCEVKSPGQANGTIVLESGNTERAGWAESSGEKAVAVLTGKGAKEEFVVLQFTEACKLPLGVKEVNVKGQVAANSKPAALMSQMGELEFPETAITKYFTGSAPGTEVKLKTLEVEAVGGLAKAPAIFRTIDFILRAIGLLPWLGLLASGGMGTR